MQPKINNRLVNRVSFCHILESLNDISNIVVYKKVVMVNRPFCHINMAILPNTWAKIRNTTNSQLQNKNFKVNICQFLTTLDERNY
jgi:hypothetical protein